MKNNVNKIEKKCKKNSEDGRRCYTIRHRRTDRRRAYTEFEF